MGDGWVLVGCWLGGRVVGCLDSYRFIYLFVGLLLVGMAWLVVVGLFDGCLMVVVCFFAVECWLFGWAMVGWIGGLMM